MTMDLVGVAYKDGGLAPEEGFDCYGVVRFFLNAELGLDLPEKPPQTFAWPRYVKIYKHPFPPLRKYDVVMFDEIIPGLVNHIGVMATQFDVLHAGSKFGGVVCESVGRYKHMISAVGRPIL